ncbi:MAG TPA: CHAT domain-containing protein [Candidatus Limnocylindria bacterium]|nr:CHAT domain-containing protein [Candidatus Limnocylindria bacterium]
MADCRLTTAERIDVTLDMATITVRLGGVQLNPNEVARVVLVEEEAWETRCRVEACVVLDSPGAESDDHEEAIQLDAPPRLVVIEHAEGLRIFRFDPGFAMEPGPPLPADPVLPDPMAEPEPPPNWTPSAPSEPIGPITSSPGPYYAPPPPPPSSSPGGRFKDWIGGWFKGASAPPPPQAGPSPAPMPGPPPPPAFEPEPIPPPMPAIEIEDPGPITTVDDEIGPFPGMAAGAEPPPPAAANGDGPKPGMETAGPETPKPKGLFPRLDAPEFFPVGVPTDIVVGIRPDEDVMIGGGAMLLPPDVGDKFFLSVQVIADGFELGGNTTSLVHDLAVTPQQPFPFVELTLVAKPIDVPAKAAIINVIYTVNDQVIGKAKRAVAVAMQQAEAEKVDLPDVAVKRAMALPIGPTAADLTVVILIDDTGPGDRLLWAFRTPHEVKVPERDCVTEIGKRPEAFAEALRKSAESAEGKPTLLKTMRGIGRDIAGAMHKDFWRVFDEVRKIKQHPTVLFLSEEPHVPWELGVLPESIDPANDKFVAAEAVTGRWLLIDGPQMPPPEKLVMKSMAVVFGEYADGKLKELKEAKAEMESLKTTFQATAVRATQDELNKLLDGNPSAEVLHFAIHGKFREEGADLLMEDGTALGPFTIKGSDLTNAPLVFLNACQVGAGNELLGQFAGLAQAFLSAGASAVIAPLWSVRDDIAREISLRFYPAAFGGDAPAEVLRRERASFSATDPPVSTTFLAYQFYGHPAFRLTK